ncbi:hypothetical protein [Levilactobacillus acidifarinae]|uniref:Uncharacterized protein n=1 Tax=Levilactobacillus acidifarinae DSM 19394 = JCM 15949 TaxID=1423715 RepID=A0A0R1LLD6_9LACO|nr:hypothetical protein [Levilactobacillus acidifarinae]KRK96731.1 hypothetical protein FD25_GL001656 [Levilactobacillus acidifarinae DSM 19394]GEO69903.1 hypothetical protein LAC03_18130 [Levilactobacillus acidifarinae]
MQKLVKLTSALLITMAVGTSGVELTTTAAQAKAKRTERTLPKSIRGTWWHYDGKGHYGKTTITAKKIKSRSYSSGEWFKYSTAIHSRKLSANPDKLKIHNNWGVISGHYHGWTDVRGWNQSAGDGTYYKLSQRQYHGKKVRVLKLAGGAGIETYSHQYTTKKLAKHFKSSHEIY